MALTRPAERAGLPVMFYIPMCTPAAIIFLVGQASLGLWAAVLGIATLPVLWFVARRIARFDPYLPQVLSAFSSCKIFTRNREHHGGNSYTAR